MLTKEDVEIFNGRGHRAASPEARADDARDARRMAFCSTHETFLEAGSPRQIKLAHRMRAGIGLSPEEYATLDGEYVERIVRFVRTVRGAEHAELVRHDADRLAFWDVKIQDWSTD